VIPTIRSATRDDLPVLIEIERASFSHPHWRPEDFLVYNCIVAELAGHVAGFLVSREAFPGDKRSRPEREILNLAVAPAHRRAGIATILLKHELSRGSIHFLEVRESNLAAQALYRKMGFSEVGRRSGYYEMPTERAIVMKMK
jgi:ribosomal protein S18 acetylase RimI-like enzyme